MRGSSLRSLIAVTGVLLAFAALSAAALAASPPVIESESAASITSTDATLGAQIDTENLYTAYEFEIDTNGSYNYTKADCPLPVPGYAQCESITVGEPLPAGLLEPSPEYIPAGSGSDSVSLDLATIGTTLQPSTTYHYRVIASNGGQVVEGPDQTFTTPPAGKAPAIESVSVSNLTSTDATLEAQIDTEGLPTEYEFQMWNSPCSKHGQGCELLREIRLPTGGKLFGSFAPQRVSLDLNSAGVTLQSGEYGFSVKATNAAGGTEASGEIFEAPPGAIDPLVPAPPNPSVAPGAIGDQLLTPVSGGGQPAGSQTAPTPVLAVADVASGSPAAGKGATQLGVKHKGHKRRAKQHKQHKRHKAKAGRRR